MGNKVDDDFSHRFLRCLPPRFDTLVTIIVRGGLKGVTPTQVLGDVVTQDTCHVEMEVVDKEDEKKKKKNVTFKVTTSSKGKSKKKEESSDDEDESSSSSVEDEGWLSLCAGLANS